METTEYFKVIGNLICYQVMEQPWPSYQAERSKNMEQKNHGGWFEIPYHGNYSTMPFKLSALKSSAVPFKYLFKHLQHYGYFKMYGNLSRLELCIWAVFLEFPDLHIEKTTIWKGEQGLEFKKHCHDLDRTREAFRLTSVASGSQHRSSLC